MNSFNWTPNMLAMADALDGNLRMAGGCVRDQLLGVEPSDYDFCTPYDPVTVTNRMGYVTSVRSVMPTGIDHGTVTVLFNDGSAYEVTTLRRDVETDGRHAKVEFTADWETDAARRDFTINAMMADTDGNLYDWFGGEADLRAGIVRFVGDAKTRLQEDYLRALRYYRFHARFGKEVDYDTAKALCHASPGLKTVSAERVWSEFCKLVAVEDKARVSESLRLMFTSMNAVDSGLFNQHHQAYAYAWGDHIAVLPRIVKEYSTPAVIWAMLSKEVADAFANADVVAASERLKWSGDERKQALYTLTTYRGSNTQLSSEYDYMVTGMPRDWVNEAYGCVLKSRDEYPVFPVNGHDLMAAVPGIKGVDIGLTLRALKHVWFNQQYAPTKEELLKMCRDA